MSELHIDGSEGEGGGQILRTSLALAAITGQSVRFSNVRAGRSKPGLLRQHLTALRAAAEVCGARVDGDQLGSQTLRFTPGTIRGGTYHFAVGTAGSACLVCQTVLPMLLLADAPSEVVFEGGTHAMSAPSYDFFARVFVPLLQRMGAQVEVRLDRHGFYPAGGGRFARSAGARVWLVDGALAGYRAASGKNLVTNLPSSEPARTHVARALVSGLVRSPSGMHLEAVDGVHPSESVLAPWLDAAGYRASGRGLFRRAVLTD